MGTPRRVTSCFVSEATPFQTDTANGDRVLFVAEQMEHSRDCSGAAREKFAGWNLVVMSDYGTSVINNKNALLRVVRTKSGENIPLQLFERVLAFHVQKDSFSGVVAEVTYLIGPADICMPGDENYEEDDDDND